MWCDEVCFIRFSYYCICINWIILLKKRFTYLPAVFTCLHCASGSRSYRRPRTRCHALTRQPCWNPLVSTADFVVSFLSTTITQRKNHVKLGCNSMKCHWSTGYDVFSVFMYAAAARKLVLRVRRAPCVKPVFTGTMADALRWSPEKQIRSEHTKMSRIFCLRDVFRCRLRVKWFDKLITSVTVYLKHPQRKSSDVFTSDLNLKLHIHVGTQGVDSFMRFWHKLLVLNEKALLARICTLHATR